MKERGRCQIKVTPNPHSTSLLEKSTLKKLSLIRIKDTYFEEYLQTTAPEYQLLIVKAPFYGF